MKWYFVIKIVLTYEKKNVYSVELVGSYYRHAPTGSGKPLNFSSRLEGFEALSFDCGWGGVPESP